MIKTLIFDFGDVFINLDKSAHQRELERWEISDFYEELQTLNKFYETGHLSSTEFIQSFRNSYTHLKENDIRDSWNSILVDFPRYRLDFLKKLAAEKDFKLILLSNTNDIHIEWVKEHVAFFEEFKACFDAFYLSQEISLRKPDTEIFQFVLKEHQLNPNEVLFIDDTKENTDAAANLGIHTWNINPGMQDIVDLFRVKKELF